MDWTSVTVSEETKAALAGLKRDDETWDELLARIASAYDPETFAGEIDLDVSDAITEVEQVQELVDNLEQRLADETEGELGELSEQIANDVETAAYRGAKDAIQEQLRGPGG